MDDGFYYKGLGSDYLKFEANMINYTKRKQTPIQPDDMKIHVPKSVPVPTMIEVVMVKNGAHVFHGVVYRQQDQGNYYEVDLKSAQFVLVYRKIPDFYYDKVKLNSVFSSDPPFLLGTNHASSQGSTSANYNIMSRYICRVSGWCRGVVFEASGSGNAKAAIYQDSSGEPGILISAMNTSTAVVAGFI